MSQFLFTYVLLASLCMTMLVCGRPIYNIAHMVNAVAQIDEYLGYGANAIEADVTFSRGGTAEYLYHGAPCDFGRNCWRWAYVDNYINALRERTMPTSSKFNSHLVLVMFDVKLTKLSKSVLWYAGEKFADTVLIPLYEDNPTKMKVIVSVPNLSLKDFISGILTRLRNKQPNIVEKLGWEISWEEKMGKPHQIEQVLRRLGISPGHAWLSSGSTNWLGKLYLDELKAEVNYRDEGNFFSKVYAWTLDKQSTAMKYLEIKLDGVITNYPDRVKKAMVEYNKKRDANERIRFATLEDNPIKLIKK